jgi:hypothetical protein
MAPIASGFYSMVDLAEGRVNLCHVAMANDMLAVTAENRRRAASRKP